MPTPPPPSRPGRLALRGGTRPHTAFGVDDHDAHLEPVLLHTDDRHAWDGLLAVPHLYTPARTGTLVILVHGSMGHYLAGVPRRMTFELLDYGFCVLSVNTRMANFGVVYGGGLLHEVPHDLDAALAFARERGATRIVLMGYSLGATMVTHFQALRRPPEVVGLCTLAHPSSLPRSLERRWRLYGADPTHTEVERRAGALVASDPSGRADDLVLVRRGSGPTDAPADCEVWTHRTWWSCRGPQSPHAVSADRIGQVGVPVAIIQPGDDAVLPGDDATHLERAALAAGLAVHVETVPGADHTFWGRVPAAAEAAVRWIDALPHTPGAMPRRRPPGRSRLRLLTLRAEDGVEHDALLHIDRPALDARAERTGRRTAIVHVHGNQGNFTVGALRFLADPVALAGVPVLSLETRVGNVSQLFGEAVFEEALRDLAAGVSWLADNGFDAVVASGYSLGASLAVRFAAGPVGLPLRGLATLGCAWSLPDSSRRRMDDCGARPSYGEMVDLARGAGAGEEPDHVLVVRSCYARSDSPHAAGVYTARTWWHSRGPEADAAIAHRHIARVPAPVLLIQGDADVIVLPGDAERLAEQHRRAGGTAEVALIPGAGHSLAGGEDLVLAAITGWLDRIA